MLFWYCAFSISTQHSSIPLQANKILYRGFSDQLSTQALQEDQTSINKIPHATRNDPCGYPKLPKLKVTIKLTTHSVL